MDKRSNTNLQNSRTLTIPTDALSCKLEITVLLFFSELVTPGLGRCVRNKLVGGHNY